MMVMFFIVIVFLMINIVLCIRFSMKEVIFFCKGKIYKIGVASATNITATASNAFFNPDRNVRLNKIQSVILHESLPSQK